MNFKIDPNFLFLLEQFSSQEFFYSMRNNYQSFLDSLESLFDVYMRNLPFNYRDFPMPEQVDINWGGAVLPLLRKTMDTLDFAYIRIKEGDLTYLDCASEIRSNDKGMSEFSKKWMEELPHENVKECWDFYTKAKAEAFIIENTYPTYWNQESIADEVSDISKINNPISYPIYRVNQSIKVTSNEKVEITGLYISEFEPNRIEFMAYSPEDDRGFGSVIPTRMDPETFETYYEETDWFLIERVANEGGSSLPVEAQVMRVEAGQICPKSGFWWSPANQSQSRYFEQGKLFPEIENNTWGETIWYLEITNKNNDTI